MESVVNFLKDIREIDSEAQKNHQQLENPIVSAKVTQDSCSFHSQTLDQVEENGKLIHEVKESLDTLKEAKDRETRQRNVIVFGCDIENEQVIKRKLNQIFCDIKVKVRMKYFQRIGKEKNIIKVRLETQKDVKKVLRNAHKLKSSEKFSHIYIAPDRSPQQRAERRELVEELKNKRESEPNKTWIIKDGSVICPDTDNSSDGEQEQEETENPIKIKIYYTN